MVLGLSLHAFTVLHVIICIVELFAGAVVVLQMLAGRRSGLNGVFLATAALTTLTGFLFPFHGMTPAIVLGLITLPLLLLAAVAWYTGRLRGAWFTRSSGSLHALGMFGQDVGGSPEWEEQNVTSELQSVMVNHLFENKFHTVLLTADCGVVVYSNLERTNLLALARDVYDNLLAPALKPI